LTQGRNSPRNYRSTYENHSITGSAGRIASVYKSLAKSVSGVEKEMLLQHAEHWKRVEKGRS
jgi:hypothetical protein